MGGNDQGCVSNQSPTFTADITTLSLVADIVPPPSYSGVLKTHSFLNTQLELVPVYAPSDATLIAGAYYQEGNPGGEYILDFRVTCEITFMVDHITDPIDEIRAVFPDTPKDNTQSDTPTATITLQTGDLIGYTTGTIYGIWDFGTYNSAVQNQFIDDPDYNFSERYTTAVCPYDFYAESQRSTFYNLFGRDDSRDFPGATDFCTWQTWE